MVDLANGLRFDPAVPVGCAPTVVEAADAGQLAALELWPRLVEAVVDADRVLVSRAHRRDDDPPGSVRLTLARRDGVQTTLYGAGEVCAVGPLPSRWWGWRTRDGAPLLHDDPFVYGAREGALRADWSPHARMVLLLGGPVDGAALLTDSLEIDALGRWDDGGERWRRAYPDDDDAVPVFYRVRRGHEVTHPAEWAGRAALHEWVATFEGVRGIVPILWADLGGTEPAPAAAYDAAGEERGDLLDLLERAMQEAEAEREAGTPLNVRRLAEAALDAMLADPAVGHVQREGEADPDEVLVAIVEGVDESYRGGGDAAACVQTALAVLRQLEASYTIHARGGVTDPPAAATLGYTPTEGTT